MSEQEDFLPKKRESEKTLSFLSTMENDWVDSYFDAPSASLYKIPSTPSSISGSLGYEVNEVVPMP